MNKRNDPEQKIHDENVCRGVALFSLIGIISEIVRLDYFGAALWIITFCAYSYRTMTLYKENKDDDTKGE